MRIDLSYIEGKGVEQDEPDGWMSLPLGCLLIVITWELK